LAGLQLGWLFASAGLNAKSFIQWHTGWDHGTDHPLWFWFYNTGLVFPAVAAALVWRERDWLVSRNLACFLAPFLGCFVVPNFVQLSPWVWDNIKFLFFAHVAATPLLALLIVRLWRWGRFAARPLAATVFVTLTLAGALDVTRIVTRQREARVFDAAGAQFAEFLAASTPPRAIVLRQTADGYNHPALLAGRLAPLGWPAHVWSHGLDAGDRESSMRAIYAGAADAAALLRKLRVDFIVVGPGERAQFAVNEIYFATLPLVGEVNGYRLYRAGVR
jgi:hypothetical protein